MGRLLSWLNPRDDTRGLKRWWQLHALLGSVVAAFCGVVLTLSGAFAVHHLWPKEGGGARPAKPNVATIKASGGPLPRYWSLEQFAPRIHDQGASKSCGGQATSTVAEIYANQVYFRRHDRLGARGLSAGFIWDQATGGCDCPTSFNQVFGILTGQGDDSLAEFRYDGQSWSAGYEPSSQQIRDAWPWHAAYWRMIAPNDFYTQESEMHAGRALVMLMPVDFSFLNDYQSSSVVTGQGDGFAFYHFVTLVGYTPTGPIVQNSWGSQWGNGGRVQVTWNFVAKYAQGIAVAIFPKLPPQWRPFPVKLFQSWEKAHHRHLTSPYGAHHRLTWPASIFARHTRLGGYVGSSWHPGRPGYTEYSFARGHVLAWPKTSRYKIVWNKR